MRTELISIPTPTHPLDGAYYTPDGPSKGAAMYCHRDSCQTRFAIRRFETCLRFEIRIRVRLA